MFAPRAITTPTITNIFSLWKLAIFNCILAIAILGSMYGILQHYNGQRLPDWDVPISLNTLIAFVTIIFRTSLVFVLSEIIGQAKWQYFVGNEREDPPMRRLIETSRFNDASQGLFGALKLIPTIIGYPDILLPVMAMIVSLGTGSFVQQAIQTQPCQFSTDSVNAFLPISRNITSKANDGKRSTADMVPALASALAPDNIEIGSPISAGCTTGNCTFQNSLGGLYNTLGVCSLCTDTSSLITSTKWTETPYLDPNATVYRKNYTLPNGLSIQAMYMNDSSEAFRWQTAGLSLSSIRPLDLENPDWTPSKLTGDLDWAGDLVSPEMRALSQWAFANVTIFTSNWLSKSCGYSDYLAVTCTLYPCLRTYNASVTTGKLDEVLVNTVPMAPSVNVVDSNAIADTNATVDSNVIADSNDIAEAFLEAPSWFVWQGVLDLTTNFETSLQAVQSPCLVNNTVWTEDNTSSSIEKQNLVLLQADPGLNKARHFKIENITAPTECIYSMDLWTWWNHMMGPMTIDAFNGSCHVLTSCGSVAEIEIGCDDSYWLSSLYDDHGMTISDIFERFEGFADRLSNKIRMGLLGNPEYVFGQTLQTTICIDIDYRWLNFPTVLIVITCGSLIWTIFRSWRRRGCELVWKTSILPFLFYSERFVVQNGEDMSTDSTASNSPRRDAAREALMNLDEMETEAKQQVVRFDPFN